MRRGGPTAHVIYGEAQAINSGTAAYFIGAPPARLASWSPTRDQLRIYDLYFEALRAGHAGQAIDLDGFDALMPSVVESGDSALLEQRVLAVHRLKTAAPAGCLARMGAIVGGGTDAQIEALGRFFEALGLAFQIIDDVLNLRGFKGDLKTKAEDITQGKVTLPVAKAMSRLPNGRARVAAGRRCAAKPEDPRVVGEVVAMLEACGAIDACADAGARARRSGLARRSSRWSKTRCRKLMLRAFGWYVLERHY